MLIEAKFWAGLTPNQPNQYLAQLPRGRPAEEQWGTEFAKRLLSLIPLVDDAVSSGKADKFLDRTRTNINLRWEGYGRRIRIGGVNAWSGFILDAWAEHGSTPLWLLFSYGDYERLQEADLAETHVVKWKTSDGRFCIPIKLPPEVDYDEVLDSVVASLKQIAERLNSTGFDILEDEEREA